jgi:hypothetical protein
MNELIWFLIADLLGCLLIALLLAALTGPRMQAKPRVGGARKSGGKRDGLRHYTRAMSTARRCISR